MNKKYRIQNDLTCISFILKKIHRGEIFFSLNKQKLSKDTVAKLPTMQNSNVGNVIFCHHALTRALALSLFLSFLTKLKHLHYTKLYPLTCSRYWFSSLFSCNRPRIDNEPDANKICRIYHSIILCIYLNACVLIFAVRANKLLTVCCCRHFHFFLLTICKYNYVRLKHQEWKKIYSIF